MDPEVDPASVPGIESLAPAVAAAARVAALHDPFEVALSIVGRTAMAELNRQWRDKPAPTNVLAFANEEVAGLIAPPNTVRHLGDIVVCDCVVRREADEQSKAELDHWKHMVVHGFLHLLGFDHIVDQEAEQMERLEREALAILGIDDPYA